MASSSLTTDANVQPPIISDYSRGGFTIGGLFSARSMMIPGEAGTGTVVALSPAGDLDGCLASSAHQALRPLLALPREEALAQLP